MKKQMSCLRAIAAMLAALAVAPAAVAQSSATPVVPGYNGTGGCAPGVTTCWQPGGYPYAQNTPTISTAAYSSGYVLGGVQAFTFAQAGVITNAEVVFNSGSFSGSVNLLLFGASPTGGGTTDHAALALTSTDTPKLIGVLSLSNCTTLNSGTIVQCQSAQPSAQAFMVSAGTTVYAVAQVIGTPTFAGSSDAIFTLYGVR